MLSYISIYTSGHYAIHVYTSGHSAIHVYTSGHSAIHVYTWGHYMICIYGVILHDRYSHKIILYNYLIALLVTQRSSTGYIHVHRVALRGVY